jgi:tripeptidyl-peptidase-1
MTPACIAALYKIPPIESVHPNNTFGIYETGDRFDPVSLDLFFKMFTDIPQGTRPIEQDIDLNNPDDFPDDGESDLDLQAAYPIIFPQEILLYQVDDTFYADTVFDRRGGGFLNDFLDALDGVFQPKFQ